MEKKAIKDLQPIKGSTVRQLNEKLNKDPLLDYIDMTFDESYCSEVELPPVLNDEVSNAMRDRISLEPYWKVIFVFRYAQGELSIESEMKDAFLNDDVISAAVDKYEQLDYSKLWYLSWFLKDYVDDASKNRIAGQHVAVKDIIRLRDTILKNFDQDNPIRLMGSEVPYFKLTFSCGDESITISNPGAIYSIGKALSDYIIKHKTTDGLAKLKNYKPKSTEDVKRALAVLHGDVAEKEMLNFMSAERDTKANTSQFVGCLFWSLMKWFLRCVPGMNRSEKQRLTAHIMYVIGLSNNKSLLKDKPFPLNDMKWDKLIWPEEYQNALYRSNYTYRIPLD